ncbi:glycosyltransferase family 4 protein [Trichocoleus sp. FACHB-591]|uniref:glycosyltransferase family 4 protein n=1 Tax=Trichocoleus sp. FACHB-591 TaxID=2692872 RepID=UPI00168706A1|nr:glycosyltransferase family 4 protein [Trichocoleus sp. FACHB-591]MBD2095421.1 glycosyltransferase family 4 protein [Trichocoleus sp. FACHB-591]
MRILHILNDVRELGNGIINVAIDLACLQAKAGLEVAVASDGGEYETLLADYGVTHFPLNQQRQLGNLLRATKEYRAIAQTFQPDIVHAHMMTGVVLARCLRRFGNYKLVSTVHNEFQRSATLMGVADRVIAVSQAVADSMERRGIPQRKLRVIRNGTLGSPRQRSSSLPTISLQHPAIATVAGMYQRKGITELITAFAQIAADFPEAHLYLIGEGPDRQMFEAQAQATPVSERIHFLGFQPQPQRYLQATDIFVLASHQEPFGLVLSEAREAGCAIIASNVDGIPEALDQGAAGLLVHPKDSAAIAAALLELLQCSQQLQAWKKQAQRNLAWLSVSRVHQETLAVYQELMAERDRSKAFTSFEL